MRFKYKKGVGAVTDAERRGFTQLDQDTAIAECKMAQHRVQLGRCTMTTCEKPMDLRGARWISAHGKVSTLTEWAKGLDDEYDPATLCATRHPRTPDAIREEYTNGNRGHELACRGCAMRFHHTMYGENGAGAAYDRNYKRIAAERSLSEGDLSDPSIVMDLHHTVIAYLTQDRASRLAEEKGRVAPEDVNMPAKTKKARPFGGGRKKPGYRTRGQSVLPASGNIPLSGEWVPRTTDADLLVIQAEQDAMGPTDFERQMSETWEAALKTASNA